MTSDVIVLGAGPYGLSATAYLRSAGVDARIFGDPMSFWRVMPKGMLLRSNRTATSMIGHASPYSIQAHAAQTATPIDMPYPLDRFVEYGMWVQRQVAPDVDRRTIDLVARDGDGFAIRLEDGEIVRATRVVVAAGIAAFPYRPGIADGVDRRYVSHTADHEDLSSFAGRSVLVVGGGQSALESAALLHESGADVEVVVRAPKINWLHGGKYHRILGAYAPLVYAPTDVGPMGLSRVVGATDLFRRLPRALQDPIARRSIRPAGAAWLQDRLRDIPIELGRRVDSVGVTGHRVRAELDDGSERVVDHVLFGTGYRVDLERYAFLDRTLLAGIRRAAGYPLLRDGFESSVDGLHFVGAPAAWSFGPTMRFVSGSWYAGRNLARAVVGAPRERRAVERVGAH
ncbi:MAG TPA: NAD(P)-binding domain-containing protein [Actinomycetota bacterium]|nr:NAD(P)-binding domain-containing protein [Actinomycetota bacterium]